MTNLCDYFSSLSVDEDAHEYFMAICILAAQRSKDPVTQVGACVVDRSSNLMGCGYNGMPRGCSDDDFPWSKNSKSLDNKHLFVCHAELNAVSNTSGPVENCILYVTLFPCNECAKLLIQKGITEVVYLTDKHAHKLSTIASKLMLDSAGVKYWKLEPKRKSITIKFEDVEDRNQSSDKDT